MITDEVLQAWLAEAVDDEPLPEGGLDRALAGLRPARPRGVRGRPGLRWVAATAAAGLVLVVGGVALTTQRHGTPRSTSAATEQVPAVSRPGVVSGAAGAAPSAQALTTADAAMPNSAKIAAAPRVVRTATVTIDVPASRTASSLARIRALVDADGGYVQDSTSSAGPDARGAVTLRVPSADYARLRDALAGGTYGTVASLQEQGEDVTAQYTDLAARITALEGTRAAYLALLAKARSVSDVLAVQAQISGVQEQLESLQGQLKVLADTSDDATITVNVGPAPASHHPSGWSRALHRAGHGVVVVLQGLLGASGVVALVLVLTGLLGALTVIAVRRIRRRLL